MKKAFLFFTLLSSFLMTAQTAPVIEWQKSLGGSEQDFTYSVQQTIDGGYIVAGSSKSNDGDVSGNHGDYDYWIAKLDSVGNIEWQKSLGGSKADVAYSVQQTTDNGYIVVGNSQSNDGDVSGNHSNSIDCWVVKLNSSGNIQWQKSFGGSSSDYPNSVCQTMDGGYIIAGGSMSNNGDVNGNYGNMDVWILKIDSNGNIQWKKSLGGSFWDEARSIQQTVDGGYIVAGYSYSDDEDITEHYGTTATCDAWIVKLDSSGNIVWQKSLGGSNYDAAYSVQQTSDGGYISAGYSMSNDGDVSGHHGTTSYADYWVVKLNSSGNIQWQKSFGGSDNDYAGSVQQTSDGGYIVAGQSYSNDGDVSGNHGSADSWVVKLDSSGNIQWQKSFGGSMDEDAWFIQQTTDGGYIVAGYSNSVDGDVSGHHGSIMNLDVWIVKLSPEGLATEETNLSKINIYPNPVKETLYFSEEVTNIKITDISGGTVKAFSAKGKSINVSTLAKGVYVISGITKSGEVVSKKIVKD